MCGERLIIQKADPMPLSSGKEPKPRKLFFHGVPALFRFALFGLTNTAITFGVFVGLGLIILPELAYSVAFLIGLVFVTSLSNRLVFGGVNTFPKKLLYALWYLAAFALGQLIIAVNGPIGLKELTWTSIVIIGITVPLNFLGGRFIFRQVGKSLPQKNQM